MYRQRQRMTETKLNIAFATKVSSFPLVNSALVYATGTYGRVKNYNGLLNYTLTTAEKSVTLAAEQAKPVMLKFEKQIKAADGLACKGLDKLQEKIPVITESPEEILKKSRELYASTIQTGINKYDGLKNYGSEKVKFAKELGSQKATAIMDSPYGHFLASTLNEALAVTENYVNHYLPPLEGEEHKGSEEKPLTERVGLLSDRVQNRMYQHIAKQISQMQAAVARFNTNVDVMQLWKDNLNAANLALQSTASKVWDSMNRDQLSTENAVARMIEVARNWTKLAASAMHGIAAPSYNYLPQKAKDNLDVVNKYAADLYTQLAEAKTAEERSTVLINQLATTRKAMEQTVYGIINGARNLNVLTWLVGTNAAVSPENESANQ